MVYKGALIDKSFTYNPIFYKQFIEVKNVLRKKNQTPRISENKLLFPTDNPEEEIKLKNKDSFTRDGNYALCMNTCNFLFTKCY